MKYTQADIDYYHDLGDKHARIEYLEDLCTRAADALEYYQRNAGCQTVQHIGLIDELRKAAE